MSEDATPPVTRDRIARAVREIGLIPFLGGEDQVAAILPSHVLRIVLPDRHPQQGIAEWSRSLSIRHATRAAEFTHAFNATTYLPKMTTVVTDEGVIRFRVQHTFNWGGGGSDEQVLEEVRQFVMASLSAFSRLDQQFPDPWTTEGDDE